MEWSYYRLILVIFQVWVKILQRKIYFLLPKISFRSNCSIILTRINCRTATSTWAWTDSVWKCAYILWAAITVKRSKYDLRWIQPNWKCWVKQPDSGLYQPTNCLSQLFILRNNCNYGQLSKGRLYKFHQYEWEFNENWGLVQKFLFDSW